MKKTVIWVLVAAVAVVGLGYGYTRLQSARALRAAMDELRNNLQTAEAEYRDLEVVISGKGTIQPNEKKTASSGVAGKIREVLISEGSAVREGQTVMVLQNDSVIYQAEQARLDLQLAERGLEEMSGPAGTLAKAHLDLRQAESNLQTVSDRIQELSPASPISGQVWSVQISAGDQVSAGQVLATVADTQTLTVSTKVKQEELHLVSVGDPVTVYPGGTLLPNPGTLTAIADEGVAGSRGSEFALTITVPNPDPGLRAGMSVTVTCEAKEGRFLTWGGVVAANERVDIRAEADGTVVGAQVKEGEAVQSGQIVAVLENDSLLVSRDQAMNAVEAAKQAIASCDGQIEQQKLRVRQARVNVSDKDDALRALTVQSPLTGTVVSLSKNVGDAVSANETLFQVASVEPLNVTIPVDELDIAYARVGQDARIAVDAFPELSWDGKVTKIAFEGTVKDGVTNYGVTVSLDAKEVRLGMSARVTLSVSKMAGALSVPVEAVTWDRGLSYVNKIEGRVPVQTKVRVGIQNDLYAEIISGLEEGDVVLVGSLAGWGGLRLPTNIPGMRMR